MKALLIDDEPIARRELSRLLEEHPEIEVVGTAGNVAEARARIDALEPDLLFLDIRMPGASGFDLLEELEETPHVIFTTAYDRFAARAFDIDASDYLLKPIEPQRLAVALERVWRLHERVLAGPEQRLPKRVFVRDGERCWFIDLRDIVLFEADGNGTRVLFGDEEAPLRRTLSFLETQLDPTTFFRANRSQIVSLRHVRSVEAWFGERLRLQMQGGHIVELSRRQAMRFKAQTL